MRQSTSRRIKDSAAIIVAMGVGAWWVASLESSLARTPLATGYLLFGSVLFLAAYQLRKRLPGLPLGSSRSWLRAHLIVAVLTAPLFYWHTAGRWPNGILEGVLAAVYAATFLSGVWGLYLSRTIPRQLARLPEQHLYERVPRLQRGIANEARDAVMAVVHEMGADTLANFYADRLHGFFGRPRSFAYALSPTASTRKRLFRELASSDRYFTDGERKTAERLFALIRRKDDLDFHASRQGLLKLWLLVHIGLTWSLVSLAVVHGIVALAFLGGPTA